MLKKITALLIAATMCLSFAACSGDDNSSSGANSADSSDTANTGNSSTTDSDGNSGEVINTVYMNVGGEDVPYDLFRYYFLNIRSSIDYGVPSLWEDGSLGDDAVDYLMGYVSDQVALHYAVRNAAADLGISINPEDKAEIESVIEEYKTYADQNGVSYDEFLESYLHVNEEYFREALESEFYYNTLFDNLYGENGTMLELDIEDDEYRKYVTENYVHCNHILISFDHFAEDEAYADATEDELKTAAKELADELYQRVIDGEDLYELCQEYGDDPGMDGNEAGYTFSYGEMVQEFEDATFALEINGVSEPVETSYGYHVIQRLELEDDAINTYAFYAYIDKLIDDTQITYTADFDALTPTSIS